LSILWPQESLKAMKNPSRRSPFNSLEVRKTGYILFFPLFVKSLPSSALEDAVSSHLLEIQVLTPKDTIAIKGYVDNVASNLTKEIQDVSRRWRNHIEGHFNDHL
jgi:hypothetical protein